MGDFALGFVASVLANQVQPVFAFFNRLANGPQFERHLCGCLKKAINRWDGNDKIKQKLRSYKFSSLSQILQVLGNPEAAEAYEGLPDLLIDEIVKDNVCAKAMATWKLMELADNSFPLARDSNTLYIDSLVKLPAKGRKSHSRQEGYIRRFVSTDPQGIDFESLIGVNKARRTLQDYVKGEGNGRIILYSSAQSGKTTELNQLCWELQESGSYIPIIYDIINNSFLSREDLPSVRFIDGKELVVLFDGLDEVNGNLFNETAEVIRGFAADNNGFKVVVSCRSNYNLEDVLPGFQPLYFEDLSNSDIKEHIRRRLGNDNNLFNQICDNNLLNFAVTPFFLNCLIEAYRTDGRLPKSRSEIYRFFLLQSYNKESRKKGMKGLPFPEFEDVMKGARMVAMCMSMMTVQSMSMRDLAVCLEYEEAHMDALIRCDILKREGDNVTFSQNAFREWLAASFLSECTMEMIRQLTTYPNNQLKPEWNNIILLWLSMLNGKEAVREAISWLNVAAKDLIVTIDTRMVEESTRNEVFKAIVLNFKRLNSRLPYRENMERNLARFGQSEASIRFLISEIKQTEPGNPHHSNLMEICNNLDWRLLLIQNENLAEELFESMLEKELVAAREMEVRWGYHQDAFENGIFGEERFFTRIFDALKSSDRYYIVDELIRLIRRAGRSDDCIDYILEKEGTLHDQHTGFSSYAVSRSPIYQSLSTVEKPESICKILNHKFYNNYSRDSFETREFGEMMKRSFDKAADFIREGKLTPDVLEDFLLFKKKSRFDAENFDSLNLYGHLRNCYIKAGLRERGMGLFYQGLNNLKAKARLDKVTEDEIWKIFVYASLWMEEDNIRHDFDKFDRNSEEDHMVASWYSLNYDPELSKLAQDLYREKFEDNSRLQKQKELERADFKELEDYSIFRERVLETAEIIKEDYKRGEFHLKVRARGRHLNRYVESFIYEHYVDYAGVYDLGAVKRDIENHDVYEDFFMASTGSILLNGDRDGVLSETAVSRCIERAEDKVKQLAEKGVATHQRTALSLLLRGWFEVEEYTLLKLLKLPGFKITGGRHERELTLFELIAENVDPGKLGPAVIKELENSIGKRVGEKGYQLARYILCNGITEGFPVCLKFAISKEAFAGNILEEMVKEDILLGEMKDLSRTMSRRSRMLLYESMERNGRDYGWVKDEVERIIPDLEGYEFEHALGILLKLGSTLALTLFLDRPQLLSIGDEWRFIYTRRNAIKPLLHLYLYLLLAERVRHDFTADSIRGSLSSVALLDEKCMLRVKEGFERIAASDGRFRSQALIARDIENNFYACQYGISDVKTAMERIIG